MTHVEYTYTYTVPNGQKPSGNIAASYYSNRVVASSSLFQLYNVARLFFLCATLKSWEKLRMGLGTRLV